MNKVFLFSFLLIVGLVCSQIFPFLIGMKTYLSIQHSVQILAMVCLSFIMIRVGLGFTIDKNNLRGYAWDYFIAGTAAGIPWILCSAYFIWVLPQSEGLQLTSSWKEALVVGRFAAPTSAGVLFSMLAAAGLGASWLFRKIQVLAIFDDLDTILLMIPLKIILVGFHWELVVVLSIMATLLFIAWRYMHTFRLPTDWHWLLFYSIVVTGVTEGINSLHHFGAETIPFGIEVLLPAFVLGMIIKNRHHPSPMGPAKTPHEYDSEDSIVVAISAIFLFLVGLSMPPILPTLDPKAFFPLSENLSLKGVITTLSKTLHLVGFHVLVITLLSNLGKMFPAFCYRKEASLRERIALAIGMWPRGEVGAGIIIVSLSLGIKGPVIAIAILSLALNLILTGFFIAIIKILLSHNQKIA